jgi:hypothetical protein
LKKSVIVLNIQCACLGLKNEPGKIFHRVFLNSNNYQAPPSNNEKRMINETPSTRTCSPYLNFKSSPKSVLFNRCLQYVIHSILHTFSLNFSFEIFFKHIFFIMGHQRPSNGEYTAGEKKFFEHSWSPGEPSEDRPIKHRENTFMSIKIDRVIRFCSTFF